MIVTFTDKCPTCGRDSQWRGVQCYSLPEGGGTSYTITCEHCDETGRAAKALARQESAAAV